MANLLTVVIPTLNEEKDLPALLDSLSELKSDVLVVDSGSTDSTEEIAKQFGARVIHHDFISFCDQRNFADSKVATDWILSIEADVTVSPELAAEINKSIKNLEIDAYFIKRLNIIWGKPILHTNWGPEDDKHIWLYRRGLGEWQGKIHEEFKPGNDRIGTLHNYLVHQNYRTISEFLNKSQSYSNLALKNNNNASIFNPAVDFVRRYFWKMGFLDGYHGLFLSYLQSVYFLTLWVKRTSQS